MMTDLLLTYIVPVYNMERIIGRCLQSLVKQDLPEDAYEIIVVDDGSTDGSRAVVEAMAQSHPQLRLLCQDNQGVSQARNFALESARGKYVQFVDSDDLLLENRMAPLVQRAVDEALDVLVFNYNIADISGNVTLTACDTVTVPDAVTTGVEYLQHHRMSPYVWRYLIRRDYIIGNGWQFNKELIHFIVCEDGDFIAHFLLDARRVVASDVAPYCYVNRSDSAMHNQDRDHLRNRILSQVNSAVSIEETIRRYEEKTSEAAPASARGLRNVYLYFSMTKALTTGCVDETLAAMKQAGLYPFPCVGSEADYSGAKWRVIHRLMMCPRLWKFLSVIYRAIKK